MNDVMRCACRGSLKTSGMCDGCGLPAPSLVEDEPSDDTVQKAVRLLLRFVVETPEFRLEGRMIGGLRDAMNMTRSRLGEQLGIDETAILLLETSDVVLGEVRQVEVRAIVKRYLDEAVGDDDVGRKDLAFLKGFMRQLGLRR